MAKQSILIRDKHLHVNNLEIRHRDVVDFFSTVSEEDRESRFIHAVELGVFCLQRTTLSLDADFHKRQIEGLLREVEAQLSVLPSATQEKLVEKIGTKDGQVLAPIKIHVDAVLGESRRRLSEVKKLLDQKLDPDSRKSTLGKALQGLQQMLNPRNHDSVQASLEEAVSSITSRDGTLVKTVRKVVKEITDPLKDEVERLTTELHAEEKAEEVRQSTTLKGTPFEREILAALNSWKQITGAQIEYVGPEHKPGDITVKFAAGTAVEQPFAIVIEARDRAEELGVKRIKDYLDRSMSTRQADAAIYVSRTGGGLAREVGEWCEGTCARGRFVACTHEHLVTALRFLIVQQRIDEIRSVLPAVDATTILAEIQRIRTALKRITNINGRANEVRNSAEAISTDATALRDEIRDALSSIERSIQLVKTDQQPKKLAARA